MVLLLPPAPAALVLLGRAVASFSFWSAAALRRMAVRAPPGGAGVAVDTALDDAGPFTGDVGRGDDIFAQLGRRAYCK